MTITSNKFSHRFTETDMLAFAVRFEIRGSHGQRRYYVDGVEVNAEAYNRAFHKAMKAEAEGKQVKPFPRRSRR